MPHYRKKHALVISLASALVLTAPACAADPEPNPALLESFEKIAFPVETDPEIAALENGLIDLSERNDEDARSWSIRERMALNNVPGMAVVVFNEGENVLTKGYGVQSYSSAAPIDQDTVFSVGSVSKIINAALVLRLVDEGLLDLDTDVNQYLTRWKVPDHRHTRREKVTLRRLLSHTSGLSQHGFADFQPGEVLPTIVQTLNGKGPAKHGRVRPLFEPGSKMRYSGGGTTVSQLVIEEVTGLSYNEAASKYVFEPLGMTRSTFENPLPPTHGNIAKAHGEEGQPRALPRGYEAMPEQAASGLWTSAHDMGLFLGAVLNQSEFLSAAMWAEMLQRAPNSWHGLGPRLNGVGEGLVFHHGGSNDSYQAWFEGHPHSQNGILVLTNAPGGRMLGYEMRYAAERVLGWNIRFPDDYREPEL